MRARGFITVQQCGACFDSGSSRWNTELPSLILYPSERPYVRHISGKKPVSGYHASPTRHGCVRSVAALWTQMRFCEKGHGAYSKPTRSSFHPFFFTLNGAVVGRRGQEKMKCRCLIFLRGHVSRGSLSWPTFARPARADAKAVAKVRP